MNRFVTVLLIAITFSACTKTEQALVIPDLMPRSGDMAPAEFKKAQESVATLRTKIKEHPEVLKQYSQLAQVFIHEARITGRHHEYYPIADRLVDEALTRDGKFFDALFLKASIQMTKHQFAEAKVTIVKAIAVDPYSSGAYGVLADANTELGLYDEAA